jgi:hypothetical protein
MDRKIYFAAGQRHSAQQAVDVMFLGIAEAAMGEHRLKTGIANESRGSSKKLKEMCARRVGTTILLPEATLFMSIVSNTDRCGRKRSGP